MSDEGYRRPDERAWRDPVLAVVFVAGLGLRVAGLSGGLPDVYNPDEVSILSRALGLGSGDLNPHNFLYPSLFFYVLAAVTGLLAGAQWALGQVSSIGAFEARFWEDPTSVYLAARLLVAMAGALTVPATYAVAQRVGGIQVARVSAALMAVAYVPVRDAHVIKHDVPATLLILLAVLASWKVWKSGRVLDYLLAGVSAGVAASFHYYGVYAVVPIVAAHGLRSGIAPRAWLTPRVWLSAAAMLLAFSACSPYVLLDYQTAMRDIQANRLIIVDRAQRVFGPFGSAMTQISNLLSQATIWIPAAVAGAVALWRASVPLLAWTASFPLVFFLFISNTWPFGRTANPLYPFLAILGAYGIVAVAHWVGRRGTAVLALLALAAVIQPLALSARAVYLLRQSDTRTLAREWIHAHVPGGASVAVEPYSVQLQPTRERLAEALANAGLQPGQSGRRSKALLARTPYPSPSYRLVYIGEGGMDQDKIYLPPEWFTGSRPDARVRSACVEWVILKSAAPSGPNPLAPFVAQSGTLVHRVTPFREPGLPAEGWLPDTDVTPSLRVTRPGPVIEIWHTPSLCDAAGAGR